jgi:polysaccharide export outer membrane protein
VNNPGVHQIRGEAPLLEVLALAGGLRQDAGSTVTLTRSLINGAIPLPFAQTDAAGKYSVAEINLDGVMNGDHPEYNTSILPNDVVSVKRAEMVYVVGDVTRTGGFVLNEKQSLSVLQALSMAGGLRATAAADKSKIIRGSHGNPKERQEIAVDVKRILSGKQDDLPMYPDDILFIPDSKAKKIAIRSAEAILQTVSGIMIFRGGNN